MIRRLVAPAASPRLGTGLGAMVVFGMLWSVLPGCSSSPSVEVPSMETAPKATTIDLDQKRPGDEREVRALVLDNGLEVLLVSDPKMQKSAAALDVAVGSMEDPRNGLGQAHFLEHLLFLGTKKYPDVEEYSEYLAANGGSGNAYTADENTNYQLEVNHDALQGALDRFAQFFIEPLFDAEFVERERNAVNSEHQKNVQSDGWRRNQVFTDMAREGHPFGKFSTGTLETLAGATREQIIDFYQRTYSANVMKLCVMGNHPLDTLEAWTKESFSAVPNQNRADLVYPADVWDEASLPRMVELKPVTDQRTVSSGVRVAKRAPALAREAAECVGIAHRPRRQGFAALSAEEGKPGHGALGRRQHHELRLVLPDQHHADGVRPRQHRSCGRTLLRLRRHAAQGGHAAVLLRRREADGRHQLRPSRS